MTDEISRDEVHQALEALYDDVALSEAALVFRFSQVSSLTNRNEQAQRLRAILLEAIERLRPVRRAAFASREARACDVLTLRYVERMGIAEMTEELSLGRRQVFRDLEQAEEKLGQILQNWAEPNADVNLAAAVKDDYLSTELAILASQPVQVHLGEIATEALALVVPLAAKRNIQINYNHTDDAAEIVVDRAMFKQLLVQLLSWAVQNANKPDIALSTGADTHLSYVRVLFHPEQKDSGREKIQEIRYIAEHEGIKMRLNEAKDICDIELALARRQPLSILVVEDNPGAVELYRRYLANSQWQLSHISEPRLTFEMAKRLHPDVIILDVMMPNMDGWSVLQALRQNQETAKLPVVICSVVTDDELGLALGATACLKKPVSQAELLTALQGCLQPSSRRR